MKKLLLTICEEIGYIDPPNKHGITVEMLIDGYLQGNIVKYVVSITGCNKNTVTRALAKTFPDRDTVHDTSIGKFLLRKWGLRYCSSCSSIKESEEFYNNISKSDGISDLCKECNKEARKASYASDPQKEIHKNSTRKRQRDSLQTPLWANSKQIAEFYRNRPSGYHVDHMYPLNSDWVCGLHVIENLQYLPALENLSKGNRDHGTII